MADTKQATPEHVPVPYRDHSDAWIGCSCGWEEFGSTGEDWLAHVASRSGPDRTLSAKEFFRNDPRFRNTNTEPYTDVELAHVNTSIHGTDVFEFAEAYASQAGPDRTTQDEAALLRGYDDLAARFCLAHNGRTINCTPRSEELSGMLKGAYAAGKSSKS